MRSLTPLERLNAIAERLDEIKALLDKRGGQSETRVAIRPQMEIQRAHDLLVGALLEEAPGLLLDDATRKYIHACADVLCWVLQHDHNPAFGNNLVNLEERARQIGYHFDQFPRV